MAVAIRLRRTGSRNRPSYRIVVAEKRKPRDGRFIEILGHYDPLKQPAGVQVDAERAVYWLQNGAQPSETVGSILRAKGITKAGVTPAAAEAKVAPKVEAPQQDARAAQPSPIG
ncbi:MAG: 30S ribosomal protein S16 [Armatimonadetes bacterium CG_4_10_14_3_um_filter_66_18]|nr:30S ribosomal protein S16 [Armatimonadota bacterium]OIP03169.1 MAG: 30S ribosomal protein S16 [Armatimonadetes bacterium CG2_30_66_41]PIU92491.1 MAG: 30S ribosomal protein S16 [Armatimonadetes bacterium CG06_land_8_20_14_3_00_66_21]PIW20699.1 MAG: 30S ribosomal protein S16 [Armatimonadetes bacterium CG17_big_fil_post_rev_8_21_14_2_50_66_6]PIX49257.1 MAG: 30S ribosomal protein S16 [Armatimonadetes bacterium CG_4_8_14_3_um_filter_66_20]PIY49870.1 MAG: 30S ribosomal protein S16 [Armatimonadete